MKSELPSPDQILEELADKAAAQIDRRAPVAFDAALGELIQHHKFLLAINATHLPDGKPFNFAEVAGLAWRRPHSEWISQYRRLFERAADQIRDDQSFIEKLAYVPLSLMSRDSDVELSPGVRQGIVDLGPMLVYPCANLVEMPEVVSEGRQQRRKALRGYA
jgi:hypothetical protein